MNVVIFRNGSHGPRQFSLTSPGFITAAVAVFAAVTALVFGAGYTLALQKNDVADTNEMRAMAEDLEVQRAALEAAKRRAQDTLDALAIRIGRMNAHIVRLDALGQR